MRRVALYVCVKYSLYYRAKTVSCQADKSPSPRCPNGCLLSIQFLFVVLFDLTPNPSPLRKRGELYCLCFVKEKQQTKTIPSPSQKEKVSHEPSALHWYTAGMRSVRGDVLFVLVTIFGRVNHPMDFEIKEKLYRKHKTQFTKKLRRKMTPEEVILWQLLRNRHSREVKFRRQVNIGPYIVDFLCKEHRIVIEVDGSIHDEEDQKKYDLVRDTFLRELDYKILRIRNEDIHKDIQNVLKNIHNFIQQTVPSPSQRRGLG
jgi:very-short-patch-repair endonuclease